MCLLLASVAFGEDWPQFHGPKRNSTSAETGLMRSWPAGGPKVLWTVQVGAGYGGAAIQGGKVYILDRPDRRTDAVRCLNFATGKEEWSFSYPAPGRVPHDGSRSTPAVDDKYVFTIGCFGHVHCISKETKKPVWTKHLLKDYGGGRPPRWGIPQSPLLHGNTVIVSPQSREAGVVALAKDTGKEVWRSKSIGRMDYVSPTITTIDGVAQVIMVNSSGTCGVDAASGKVLWKYDGVQCRIPIPNATAIGDGRIFIVEGYDAGCAMIKVAKGDDGTFTVAEQFKHQKCNSQMNPAMLYKGHLYANSYSNSDKDGFMCLDLDGKVLWQTAGKVSFQRGHMLLADGMIFIIDGAAGSLYLVEPDPTGYKELAKVGGLLGGREIWGPLSLSDGKLIIRDQNKMLCLDVKAK
jgi:outer membrane protein assembly factor BamB